MIRSVVSTVLSGLLLLSASGLLHAEIADRDKPIHMESDRVAIDNPKQESEFEGKVRFTQGTLSIAAEKLVARQDQQGYKHCTANGQPASFRQKHEGADGYIEGYGERIEYDTRAETIDLFGQARVKREQDDVQGNHIHYNTRTEVFQVVGETGMNAGSTNDGRVHAVLQPKKENGIKSAPANTDTLTIRPSSTLSTKP